MITCEQIKDRITAYRDKETSPQTADQISRHIDTCETCGSELDALNGTMDLMHQYLESFAMEKVKLDLPETRIRRRKPLLWAAAAAAVLALCVGVYILFAPSSSVYAAMTQVARELKTVKDFTARFSKVFEFAEAKEGGETRIRTSGTIHCRIRPATSIRCTETWNYFDENGTELEDFTEAHDGARTPDMSWARMKMGNSYTSTFASGMIPRDIFRFFDDRELLPPAPRRAAFELAALLTDFGGAEYLNWFGREWSFASEQHLPEGSTYGFISADGLEIWEFSVITGPGGSLDRIELKQTLTDSAGSSLGSLFSVYDITGTNTGMNDSIFNMPEE